VNGYGAELQRAGAVAVKVGESLVALVGSKPTVSPVTTAAPRPTPIVSPKPRSVLRPAPKISTDGSLSGPEQRILNSLAWFDSIGVTNPENVAVAFMAGYTLNGSYFNARGKLNQAGRVEYLGDDRLRLTEDGRALATPTDAPTTNEALHDYVLARLGGPEQRILKPLLAANETLSEASGYTMNGSYFNARGRLRSFGMVDYVGGGVKARDILFPV